MSEPDYLACLYLIPEHMQEAVVRWIEYGYRAPPGDFLSAFLSNDLRETFGRADDTNLQHIKDYVVYFYNYAPAGCWGRADVLETWDGIKPLKEEKSA